MSQYAKPAETVSSELNKSDNNVTALAQSSLF